MIGVVVLAGSVLFPLACRQRLIKLSKVSRVRSMTVLSSISPASHAKLGFSKMVRPTAKPRQVFDRPLA